MVADVTTSRASVKPANQSATKIAAAATAPIAALTAWTSSGPCRRSRNPAADFASDGSWRAVSAVAFCSRGSVFAVSDAVPGGAFGGSTSVAVSSIVGGRRPDVLSDSLVIVSLEAGSLADTQHMTTA